MNLARERERQRETERETERDRERDRERQRETERDRERHLNIMATKYYCCYNAVLQLHIKVHNVAQ